MSDTYNSTAALAIAAFAMPDQIDTPNDWTGNGNNGVWNGTAAYADGLFGRAFSFSGSSYINIGTLMPSGSAERSVFWRQKVAANHGGYIFGYGANTAGRAFRCRASNNQAQGVSGAARIEFESSYQVGTTLIPDQTWISETAVVPNGAVVTDDVLLYLAGTEITRSQTGSQTLNTTSGDFWIGNDVNNNTFQLTGLLTEFMLFDFALSTSQITQLDSGPEPINLTAPTLDIFGNWNIGSWNSQNNGEIAYMVQLLKNSVPVAELTGTSGLIDFSQYGYGEYQLSVSASNNGGNDPTQDRLTTAFYYGIPEATYIQKRVANYTVTNVIATFQNDYNQLVEPVGLTSFIKRSNGIQNTRDTTYLNSRFKKRGFE